MPRTDSRCPAREMQAPRAGPPMPCFLGRTIATAARPWDAWKMPSWTDVKLLAASRYKMIHDDGESFEVLFDYKTGRHQKIMVTHLHAFNVPWIRFRSFVCHRNDMDPLVALAWNAELSLGALALIDDHYAVLHTTALDTLDPEEFDRPLRIISIVADKLEKDYTRGKDIF